MKRTDWFLPNPFLFDLSGITDFLQPVLGFTMAFQDLQELLFAAM
jgi:hypothetical protein